MSVIGAAADSPLELLRMKHAAEEYVRRSQAAWTMVRASAFFETWIALLEQTAAGSGRPLVFGRGDNPINFVSVVDVAALLERVIADPSSRGRALQIGGPQNLTLNELASAVQRSAGRTQQPRHVPRFALHAMATLLRPIKPDLARQARAALVMDTVDMTFGSTEVHERYVDLPTTLLSAVLGDDQCALY